MLASAVTGSSSVPDTLRPARLAPLQVTKKQAKTIAPEMVDSVTLLQESIQSAVGKAERDNASIYLERVPPYADLPAVLPACLVKSVPPTGLDAAGERLFSGEQHAGLAQPGTGWGHC